MNDSRFQTHDLFIIFFLYLLLPFSMKEFQEFLRAEHKKFHKQEKYLHRFVRVCMHMNSGGGRERERKNIAE
jgi:hypothetical protein